MGNKQSIDDGTFDIAVQKLVFDKKCNDSRFGEVKWLLDPKNGTKILQKDYTTNTTKDFERYLNQVKRRSNISHPKIIRILGHSAKHDDAFCANYYKISIYFESFEYDLEEELRDKIETKQKYSEAELWSMIENVVSACAYLQTHSEFHGDIRPYNILYTASKDYKILDNQVLRTSTFSSYFAHAVDLEDKSRLYSPASFASLIRDKEDKIEHDSFKSDVFSLGMTILQCASLTGAEELYDWKKFEINFDQVQERLNSLSETYSANLINIIRLMLSVEEADRPDFLKLEPRIARHCGVGSGAGGASGAKTVPHKVQNKVHQSPENDLYESNNQTPRKELEYSLYDEEELDRRIKRALEKSAEAIRNSPAKHIAENSDAYFNHFMNNFKSQYGIRANETFPSPVKSQLPIDIKAEGTDKTKVESTTSQDGNYSKDYQPNTSSINASAYGNPNGLKSSSSNYAPAVSPNKYGAYYSNYKPYVPPNTNPQNPSSSTTTTTAAANKYGSYVSSYQPYVPKSGTTATTTYQPRTTGNPVANAS